MVPLQAVQVGSSVSQTSFLGDRVGAADGVVNDGTAEARRAPEIPSFEILFPRELLR